MTLHPALAAVRLAVRRDLAGVGEGPILVACSGGADSLALLAATAFEVRGSEARGSEPSERRVIGVTVDHGLQDGSAELAERVVVQMVRLGASETVGVRVDVDPGGRGVEAAAREARYAVLEEVAARMDSGVVLLGHTLDDQAETVLLGLARGSGGRSIAGMRPAFGPFRRPLLGITRQQTVAACGAGGIEFWDDPHNEDPRFTRARVRHRVMPVLEEELGPGVAAALARTAEGLRPDMEALDVLAARSLEEVRGPDGIHRGRLVALEPALVGRVLRLSALEAGAVDSELFRVHVQAMNGLVRGVVRGEVQLPGHVTAYLHEDHLRFRRTAVES